MAEEALALHVDGLVEDGEALPEPSTLDAVMELPDSKGGVAIRVGRHFAERRTATSDLEAVNS